MPNINVKVRSLWGAAIFRDYNVSDAITIEDLILLVAADDNLASNYYGICLARDHTKNDLTFGDSTTTLSALGAIEGDGFLTFIKKLPTKEEKLVQKLEIAQAKRQADGNVNVGYYRTANVYNIDDLPTKYSGNNIVNNPNPEGLLITRPWTGILALAAPATIEEALPESTLFTLESWYDGSDNAAFVPTNPSDGQTFTQWVDKSDFAHNANPIGGATTRASYQTNEQNSLSVVRFDGNDGLSINPYASLASAPALTVFAVMKMTATAGNPRIFATNSGATEFYYDSTAGRFVVEAAGGIGTSTVTNDATAFHIHSYLFNGSESNNSTKLRYRYDKTDITLTFSGSVGTALGASNTTLYIGNNNGANFFTGDVAEFLIFLHALTSTEIQNVENYLSTKWNL